MGNPGLEWVIVHVVTIVKHPDGHEVWGVFLSREAAEDAVLRAGPDQVGTDWEITEWPAQG